MYRIGLLGIGLFTLSTLMGCAMCCGPYDDDYNLFGGKYQRVDPAHGRVGSILSDPVYMGTGASADSNLAPVEEAPPNRLQDFVPGTRGGAETENNSGFQQEIERLRQEMNLNGRPNGNGELPSPRTQPQPNNNSNTSAGLMQRKRMPARQWR